MIITESDLHAILPRCDLGRWHGPLTHAMASAGLNTPRRAAMFLAQIGHESDQLTRVEESLDYSAARLLALWPQRFDPTMAARYAHHPERIANIVYAHRLGNGPAASGDGWRFRGRGPIQITGRANYRDCGAWLRRDLEADPAALLDPAVGAAAAVWFFCEKARGIDGADRADLEAVTRRINGGLRGLSERTAYYRAAMRRLST